MTLADDLRAAKKVIDTPEKWTKEAMARDSDGRIVFANSPDACRWCAAGAVERAAPDLNSMAMRQAFRSVLPKMLIRLIPTHSTPPMVSRTCEQST